MQLVHLLRRKISSLKMFWKKTRSIQYIDVFDIALLGTIIWRERQPHHRWHWEYWARKIWPNQPNHAITCWTLPTLVFKEHSATMLFTSPHTPAPASRSRSKPCRSRIHVKRACPVTTSAALHRCVPAISQHQSLRPWRRSAISTPGLSPMPNWTSRPPYL